VTGWSWWGWTTKTDGNVVFIVEVLVLHGIHAVKNNAGVGLLVSWAQLINFSCWDWQPINTLNLNAVLFTDKEYKSPMKPLPVWRLVPLRQQELYQLLLVDRVIQERWQIAGQFSWWLANHITRRWTTSLSLGVLYSLMLFWR